MNDTRAPVATHANLDSEMIVSRSLQRCIFMYNIDFYLS